MLKFRNLPQRVDHRSYIRQGVQKIPTVHMGVAATQMERRGLVTGKGAVNREIAAQNRLLKEIKARITRLYNWSKQQCAGTSRSQTNSPIRQGQSPQRERRSVQLFAGKRHFLHAELHAKVTAMQTEYYGLRDEVAATADNKPVRQRPATIKPRAREKLQDAHSVELALYDAAVWYLDELKASGEKISTPKHWQAEMERLTAQNGTLYQQMKAMRADIQSVEKIRKSADELARSEKSRNQMKEPER